MDNLSALWETFSLTESEGSMYNVDDGGLEGKFLLAARFFTVRALNIEAIARTFKLLWHTKRGFEVRDMGDNRMLFIFSEKSDADRVLAGEPWSFDRFLVALKRIGRQTEMKGLVFDSAHFWLQVHDLPISSLKLRVAQDIASVAGEVLNTGAEDEDYEGSQFLRVRVKIDITKPLCRGRKIGLSSGEEGWVSFKYERLPNVCYWCGRLTHHDRDCSVGLKRKGASREVDKQFGPWLRANTPNLAKKSVIRVAGYEEEVNEDIGAATSPEWGNGGDADELNILHKKDGSD